MAAINDINVVFDYYAAVWKYFSRDQLALLFDDSIEYIYFIEGSPGFELYTKHVVLSGYYEPWFKKCQISSTKIHSFNLVPYKDSIRVEYEIEQKHDETLWLMKFREIFQVKSGKITSIHMHRLHKISL